MLMPLVSVIVIGYNVENYIEQCLSSVMSQDYDNIEVIFVNDGSTDNTLNIAKRISKQNPKIRLVSKENGGIVSARIEGFKCSSGDYIAFVDGDDWTNPTMISSLVQGIYLDDSREADIVVGNIYYQNINGEFEILEQRPMKEILIGEEYLLSVMTDELAHFMFGKLYKRCLLERIRYGRFPHVTMAEDLLTNCVLGLQNPLVHIINKCNYYYRYNVSSCSRAGDYRLLEQMRTLRYIEKYVDKQGMLDQYRRLIDYQWFSYAFLYLTNEQVDTRVKKRIASTCCLKMQLWKKNKYVKRSWSAVGKKTRLYFLMQILHPSFLVEITAMVRLYRFCKESFVLVENKAYDCKMKYSNRKRIASIKDSERIRMFLIGTSDRSNIGDHTIADSEKDFLEAFFSDYQIEEITGDCYRQGKRSLERKIKKEDVLLVSGGGFLGELWKQEDEMVRDIIRRFSLNKVIILPQTVFFYQTNISNSDYNTFVSVYNGHKKLRVFLRDNKSCELMKKIIGEKNVGLYPDMALLSKRIKRNPCTRSKEVLLCFRNDKEKVVTKYDIYRITKMVEADGFGVKYTSTLAEGKHSGDIQLKDRKNRIINKIDEFSKASLVITDRLHGMIISILSGTPCIAFDNISEKVGGVYAQWLECIPQVKVVFSFDEFCRAYLEIKNLPDVMVSLNYLKPYEYELYERINSIIEE